MHYRIDDDRETVFTTAEGVCTDTDLQEHLAGLTNDPNFKPFLNQLIDLRDVTSWELTTSAFREAARGAPFGEGSRRAFVVAKDLTYGMARMYQILTDEDPAKVSVFRDIVEANEWLGLE